LEQRRHLAKTLKTNDTLPKDLESDYSVGKTQNNPMNIFTFLHDFENDPAVAVSYHSFEHTSEFIPLTNCCQEFPPEAQSSSASPDYRSAS
jgi:hypothetical protein